MLLVFKYLILWKLLTRGVCFEMWWIMRCEVRWWNVICGWGDVGNVVRSVLWWNVICEVKWYKVVWCKVMWCGVYCDVACDVVDVRCILERLLNCSHLGLLVFMAAAYMALWEMGKGMFPRARLPTPHVVFGGEWNHRHVHWRVQPKPVIWSHVYLCRKYIRRFESYKNLIIKK